MRKFLALSAISMIAVLSLCGKDEEGNPSNAAQSAYMTDTAIVRAILDQNGLTTIGVRTVSREEIFDEVTGDARIVELRLGNLAGGGKLSVLPGSIGDLSQLRQLELQGNELATLPKEIGKLNKLTNINLSRNKLVQLPDEISGLTALTMLKAPSNNIAVLPSTIGSLPAITNIELDSNSLTSLPNSIGTLSKLEVLRVANNQISSLPPEITNLKMVSFLDIDGNCLSTVTTEIEEWIGDMAGNWKLTQQGCN